MGWEDLLQQEDERVIAPWVGGKFLLLDSRRWKIQGKLPEEHGWYEWRLLGRKAELVGDADVSVAHGEKIQEGYLVGDLFVSDREGGEVKNPQELMGKFDRVHLLEPLDHFERVQVRRYWDLGPLVFIGQAFPLGPETEVLDAFVERKDSVKDISEVPPALDLCFRMKTWHREWVEFRREEERKRREEEQRRLEAEAKARELREKLGDGQMRREVALVDFEAAARAALAVGGAQYIEHRKAHGRREEYVVRYRMDGSRYECVCDANLHILDAGICLEDHDTGFKGDTLFTLESLPGVTRQAMREGAAIWRHV